MKKNSFLSGCAVALAMTLGFGSANAVGLGELNIFNHLSASAAIGTMGITIEASTPVTNFLALRAGIDILPNIKFNTTADVEVEGPGGYTDDYDVDVQMGLGRTQGHVVLNFYPLQRKLPLFVAVGGYFGGPALININGHSDKLQADIESGKIDPSLLIGDYKVPLDPVTGDVQADIRSNGFRPYVGLGWGQAIPSKIINFNLELGVQFQGSLKPHSDYGDVSDILSAADSDDGTITKVMDAFTVYPVLKLCISGKIF